MLRGLLIYSTGDTVASLILSQFSLTRMLGIMLVGATVYAFEIPRYFRWIDLKTRGLRGLKGSLSRTGLAILYFNPLWIARHLLFIALFSGRIDTIDWGLMRIAVCSFSVNIPVTLVVNFMIQNRVPFRWRFFASAVFSSLMAVYYAMSQVIF
jgi:hypothetical protein